MPDKRGAKPKKKTAKAIKRDKSASKRAASENREPKPANDSLEFNSIFKTFRSAGAEKAIKEAGLEHSAITDPRLCGLLAFGCYALAEEDNNYEKVGDRWVEYGRTLQSQPNALMICAEYYKKHRIEKIPGDSVSKLLDEAKKLEPQNPLVLELFVEHNYKTGDESGIQILKQVTADWPDFASAWLILGNHHNAAGDYQASVDAYKRGAALRPESTYAWNMLGILYTNHAMSELSKARTQYMVDQQLVAYEGGVRAEEDDDRKLNEAKALHKSLLLLAQEALNRALQIEPNQAYALAFSGMVEHALGNSEEAYARLQRSVVLDPGIKEASDFERIFRDLRREKEEASMSGRERDLLDRMFKYMPDSKRAYKSQDQKFQPWQDAVHYHFKEYLSREIKTRNETFVEYWPAFL
jgi:tetratricopeptide (TPR) repeat protein